MEKQYLINESELQKIYEKAHEVYCNLRLIELFIKENYDVDENYIVKPIVTRTKNVSDILNVNLSRIIYDEKDE